MEKQAKVTCSKCGRTFVPSFHFDYYEDANGGKGACESCMMKELFSSPPVAQNPVAVEAGFEVRACRIGEGSLTCRFACNTNGAWTCAKGSQLHDTLESRAKAGKMRALGDNCSGPPNFTISH